MGDTNPPERHPVCVPAASAGPVPAAAENGHLEALTAMDIVQVGTSNKAPLRTNLDVSKRPYPSIALGQSVF